MSHPPLSLFWCLSCQSFRMYPIADGLLSVQSDSFPDHVDVLLKEDSEHVLILTAISRVTKKPVIVETITLVDDFRRVRTVQRFRDDGEFDCLYFVREQRYVTVNQQYQVLLVGLSIALRGTEARSYCVLLSVTFNRVIDGVSGAVERRD